LSLSKSFKGKYLRSLAEIRWFSISNCEPMEFETYYLNSRSLDLPAPSARFDFTESTAFLS